MYVRTGITIDLLNNASNVMYPVKLARPLQSVSLAIQITIYWTAFVMKIVPKPTME